MNNSGIEYFIKKGTNIMQITRHDKPLQTSGEPQKVGEKMPNFSVTTAEGKKVQLNELLDKPALFSVVPDITTRVCSISTKKFNQEVDKFSDINFYTISTNSPVQQKDWCAAEGVSNMELLSDEDQEFGNKTGLFVADNTTDARSIWIVDQNGTILYQELVPEMTNEPNYAGALGFLSAL